jgi:hypothetical protein
MGAPIVDFGDAQLFGLWVSPARVSASASSS